MVCKELRKEFIKRLSGVYDSREVQSMERMVFHRVLGYAPAELSLHMEDSISEDKAKSIRKIINGLKEKKPIQYIFGDTEFHGLPFQVDNRVLIPRPETEELVAWILEDEPGNTLLDIGTGSGCIAVSLAYKLKNVTMYATDISQDALDVAKENAASNKASINLLRHDILSSNGNPFPVEYDIIVSNPPYITESEKELMDDNVLQYEPEHALFVPDDDPLRYFKAITEFAKEHLTSDGSLYFEINEEMEERMERMLNNRGFDDVKFRKDINRKTRMVRARRL